MGDGASLRVGHPACPPLVASYNQPLSLQGGDLGGWSQEGAQPEPGAVRQGLIKKRGESERVKRRG